jgi:hypothetical protein
MNKHFEDAQKTVAMTCENRSQGDPCLMFLPGWCENRGVFAPLVDRLQSRWNICEATFHALELSEFKRPRQLPSSEKRLVGGNSCVLFIRNSYEFVRRFYAR